MFFSGKRWKKGDKCCTNIEFSFLVNFEKSVNLESIFEFSVNFEVFFVNFEFFVNGMNSQPDRYILPSIMNTSRLDVLFIPDVFSSALSTNLSRLSKMSTLIGFFATHKLRMFFSWKRGKRKERKLNQEHL